MLVSGRIPSRKFTYLTVHRENLKKSSMCAKVPAGRGYVSSLESMTGSLIRVYPGVFVGQFWSCGHKTSWYTEDGGLRLFHLFP